MNFLNDKSPTVYEFYTGCQHTPPMAQQITSPEGCSFSKAKYKISKKSVNL